jgi:1-deoxy-D-xylulose-5-phosphate reductoisomerase
MSADVQQLTILGSTGSIGTQTLDVVRHNPDRYRAAFLSTNSNIKLLAGQIREFQPDAVVVRDEGAATQLRSEFGGQVTVHTGDDALCEIAAHERIDTVVSALVGFAGLRPTIAAIRAGKKIALANKETLVVAGQLINRLLSEHNTSIVPVDSEHSAIFQCLVGEAPETVEQLILTASGGPFRELPAAEFSAITVERALTHPNWSMGPKITIDSATLMNKGLEVIEARWLFNVEPEKIEVLVHPQSIVHSMVQFIDGSVKAQLGLPDMRLPIQYALAYPERIVNSYQRMDLVRLGSLSFSAPDSARFPCLRLAFDALRRMGTAPAVLNAANEVAVAAFLDRHVSFQEIPVLIEQALADADIIDDPTLENILEADKRTRAAVRSYVGIRAVA